MIWLWLFFPFLAPAENGHLENLEISCWQRSIDSDGSFRCQYVVLMSTWVEETKRQLVFPELAARSQEEARVQADAACQMLGFSYAAQFELAEGQALFVSLSTPEKPWRGAGAFVQHLHCVD